jgi:hypothetical protein
MQLIWPSLPNVCLCYLTVCGREKVPASYFKNVLSKCCPLSAKLNIHFPLLSSTNSTTSTFAAKKAHTLVRDFKNSLGDLVLHMTISNFQENLGTIFDDSFLVGCSEANSYDEAHQKTIQGNNAQTTSSISHLEGDDWDRFPNLSTLLIHIDFSDPGGDAFSQKMMTSAIAVALLEVFGSTLRSLSIFVQNLRNHTTSSSIAENQYYGESAIRTSNLGNLCPVLDKLELFGFDLRMLGNQWVSETARCSHSNEEYLEVSSSFGVVHTELPLNLPSLTVLEVEADFKDLTEVSGVLRLVPSSAKHLLLMGSTAEFLNDILRFISSEHLQNLENLVVLELHDSTPWPFCDEMSQVDSHVVLDVFSACPNLTSIKFSTVHISESSICQLLAKSVIVTQQEAIYSTLVTKTLPIIKTLYD